MNPMQTKLEQVYKEYILFKEYFEANKKTPEELREQIKAKVDELGDESILDVTFEISGEKQLEIIDLNQLAVRLYHTYQTLHDFVEIPVEIAEEVKKIDVKFLFKIENGERKIADQELYNNYKNAFLEANNKLQQPPID